MKSKVVRAVVVFLLLIVFGATAQAASLMTKSERMLTPNTDQALIIFMRPSTYGYAISSSIFDVTTEENKFIGVFKAKAKVCYDVAPGEYTFMVVGESADFMKATVEAGKTYYVLVTPRMGVWKARFSFKPLRQADLAGVEFSRWDSTTELVENTPESEEWAQKNAEDIEAKRARNWPSWCELSQELQETMTLHIEDGK